MAAPAPSKVAKSFAKQYYNFLSSDPSTLHRFYHEESQFSHGHSNNSADLVTGQENIRKKIAELNLKGVKVDLEHGSIDCQTSSNGGVLVMVTGRMDNRPFSQAFFLGKQESRYYVLNDTFRYLDMAGLGAAPAAAVAAAAPAVAAPVAVAPPAVPEPVPEPTPEPEVVPEEPVEVQTPEEPVVEQAPEPVAAPAPAPAAAAAAPPAATMSYAAILAKTQAAKPKPKPIKRPVRKTEDGKPAGNARPAAAAAAPATAGPNKAVFCHVPKGAAVEQEAVLAAFAAFGGIARPLMKEFTARGFFTIEFESHAAAAAAIAAGQSGALTVGEVAFQPVWRQDRGAKRRDGAANNRRGARGGARGRRGGQGGRKPVNGRAPQAANGANNNRRPRGGNGRPRRAAAAPQNA